MARLLLVSDNLSNSLLGIGYILVLLHELGLVDDTVFGFNLVLGLGNLVTIVSLMTLIDALTLFKL